MAGQNNEPQCLLIGRHGFAIGHLEKVFRFQKKHTGLQNANLVGGIFLTLGGSLNGRFNPLLILLYQLFSLLIYRYINHLVYAFINVVKTLPE